MHVAHTQMKTCSSQMLPICCNMHMRMHTHDVAIRMHALSSIKES